MQFHGVQFNDDQNIYLALEWINGGTLDEYLKKYVNHEENYT